MNFIHCIHVPSERSGLMLLFTHTLFGCGKVYYNNNIFCGKTLILAAKKEVMLFCKFSCCLCVLHTPPSSCIVGLIARRCACEHEWLSVSRTYKVILKVQSHNPTVKSECNFAVKGSGNSDAGKGSYKNNDIIYNNGIFHLGVQYLVFIIDAVIPLRSHGHTI